MDSFTRLPARRPGGQCLQFGRLGSTLTGLGQPAQDVDSVGARGEQVERLLQRLVIFGGHQDRVAAVARHDLDDDVVFVDLANQREQVLAGVADADCGHPGLALVVQESWTGLCHPDQR
jgi:hypothetical protein